MMHDDAKFLAAIDALRARCPAAGSKWRHTKTGTVYAVSHGAVIEATLTPAVVYYTAGSWRPGTICWVRPLDEFLDGRFTEAGQ